MTTSKRPLTKGTFPLDIYLGKQRKYSCLFRHVVSVDNQCEDKRKETNNKIKLLRIIFDSFQKLCVALKFFTGVSEVFQTVCILYVLKGVFPLNGNNTRLQSRFGWHATGLLCKHWSGESPSHFWVLYSRGLFPRINMSRDLSNSFLSLKFRIFQGRYLIQTLINTIERPINDQQHFRFPVKDKRQS